MEVYAGLFLVALGIGFLTVRFFQSRFVGGVKKDGITPSHPVRKLSRPNSRKGLSGSASPGTRGKPTARTFRRPSLVAGTIQKPWGW